MAITKRAVLGAGLAALAAPAIRAAPAKLTIFSHRIHQIVATGAQGGDITAEWTKQTGVKVEWVTFETAELEERLFREASLSSTDVDIGFILNTQATNGLRHCSRGWTRRWRRSRWRIRRTSSPDCRRR